MNLSSLKSLNVSNKTVLVRTGFDVPVEDGRVTDVFRIQRALPTLDYLAKQKAKIIILTHLDRPGGWDKNLSLRPVAEALSHLWRRKLVVIGPSAKNLPEYDIPHLYFFEHNILETDIKSLITQMRFGDVAMLENLRFYEGESKNDPEFAKKLAALGQAYVNEAFSNSHRDHASMASLPKLLPSAAGLDLQRDFETLSLVMSHPKRPLVLLLGGMKTSDRLPTLENLLKLSDFVLLGGGLANLFLKVKGFEVGQSDNWRKDDERTARTMFLNFHDKIRLPLDAVVSRKASAAAECVAIDKIKPGHTISDIGPKTILEYSRLIKQARTLIWNGPMGHFELKPFSHGSLALGRLVAGRSKSLAFGVAGGGETIEIIRRAGVVGFFDHVSTGGTSMLSALAGRALPGISALEKP